MHFATAPRLSMLKVEVIFIDQAGKLFQKQLQLEDGATVAIALETSGILTLYPDLSAYSLGIFSKPAAMDTLLSNGDRVEIYRPLQCDPKTRRRIRAKK